MHSPVYYPNKSQLEISFFIHRSHSRLFFHSSMHYRSKSQLGISCFFQQSFYSSIHYSSFILIYSSIYYRSKSQWEKPGSVQRRHIHSFIIEAKSNRRYHDNSRRVIPINSSIHFPCKSQMEKSGSVHSTIHHVQIQCI